MKALQCHRRAPGMSRFKVIGAWIFAHQMVRAFFRLFYRLRCYGKENVPLTGALVYVANHQSHFDPPLVGVLVGDRPCAFLARASLFKFKPFAAVIRFLNAIPLERGRGSGGAAMRAAIEELGAGRCVLLFPEGTRTRDGAIGPFQRGFTLLLKRSGAAVVPVAIEGAHDVWPHARKYPRLFGRISVMAGKAIDAEALLADGPDAAVDLLRRRIDAMRLELRAKLRNASGGRVPVRARAIGRSGNAKAKTRLRTTRSSGRWRR